MQKSKQASDSRYLLCCEKEEEWRSQQASKQVKLDISAYCSVKKRKSDGASKQAQASTQSSKQAIKQASKHK